MDKLVGKLRSQYRREEESLDYRLKKISALEKELKKRERDVYKALKKDLNKSYEEAYMTELSIVYNEIKYFQKNLKSLMKKKRVRGSLANPLAKNYIYYEPYGLSLIMAPWNYPVQLSLVPLVGSIASGNIAIVKLSKKASASAHVLKEIINKSLGEYGYMAISDEYSYESILNEKYDHIFFTGSERVGKIVMEAASKHLTPIVLELGGKSPVIVAEDANLTLAAKRITFGKIINAGQTCIAPDYAYIHKSVYKEFLVKMREEISKQVSQDKGKYCRIINDREYYRLLSWLEDEDIVLKGEINEQDRIIEPVLVRNPKKESPLRKQEIFGPILPLIIYDQIDEAINEINKGNKPLALYLFSESEALQDKIVSSISFGGGCINDTIMHIENNNLSFGGVGASGIGSYHGFYSFETFSHRKSMVKSSSLDNPLRYGPYSERKFKWIKKLI